jgi:phage terminase small subunit
MERVIPDRWKIGEGCIVALSDKQRKFTDEYLVDFNATQAAIRAGYSEKSAYSIGWENLRKPEIIEVIREKAMGAEEVLMRLSDMARGDIADLMEITPAGFTFRLLVGENGERIVNPQTKLIRKIKQKVTTYLAKTEAGEDREIIETELELYDAQAALVQLGKYHKLWTDKTELTGKDGGPVEVIETLRPSEIMARVASIAKAVVDGKDA